MVIVGTEGRRPRGKTGGSSPVCVGVQSEEFPFGRQSGNRVRDPGEGGIERSREAGDSRGSGGTSRP